MCTCVEVQIAICINTYMDSPCLSVRELCEAVEAVSGEGVGGVVMLTSEGQQMEPNELIGRYSVGTVGGDVSLGTEGIHQVAYSMVQPQGLYGQWCILV